MRKLTIVVVALLLIAFALPAFATISDEQQKEVDALYQKIFELQGQIADKYVEAGELTSEQAEAYKNHFNYMNDFRAQNGFHCGGPGFGSDPGARGAGYGYGGMMGGWAY